MIILSDEEYKDLMSDNWNEWIFDETARACDAQIRKRFFVSKQNWRAIIKDSILESGLNSDQVVAVCSELDDCDEAANLWLAHVNIYLFPMAIDLNKLIDLSIKINNLKVFL